MFTKRQFWVSLVISMLTVFIITTSAFVYFFHIATGDAFLTLKFLRTLQIVKTNYVEEVSTDVLMNGAIDGIMKSLEDQHSVFMSGELLKQFMLETEGHFGGIGVVLGLKDGALTVVAPIEGTPGEAAGIKTGDKIIKIDGVVAEGLPLDVAVAKIRGPKETFVELEFLTAEGKNKTVKIKRSEIKLKTVKSERLDNNTAYVRITMFNEQTYQDFYEEMVKLDRDSISGIILDLRNNPGGILDSCVKIAECFVPKGPIVSIVGREGAPKVYYSNNENPKYKLVVLVNQGSASASEIVAGAVQDTKVGTLIGTKTYGKGSVQTMMPLDDTSALKLTCAKYYTPNNREINGVGIMPDIEIEQSKTEDNVLEKAKVILKEKMKQ